MSKVRRVELPSSSLPQLWINVHARGHRRRALIRGLPSLGYSSLLGIWRYLVICGMCGHGDPER